MGSMAIPMHLTVLFEFTLTKIEFTQLGRIIQNVNEQSMIRNET